MKNKLGQGVKILPSSPCTALCPVALGVQSHLMGAKVQRAESPWQNVGGHECQLPLSQLHSVPIACSIDASDSVGDQVA